MALRRAIAAASLAAIFLLPPAHAEEVIATTPSPLTGLWWNADESGWGASIAQHGAMIFLAWYTYDAAGNPAWYVMSSCPIVGNSCSGDIHSVSGGVPLTSPWGGPSLGVTQAGSGRLTFTDNDTGTFAYTINGVSAERAITRQPLATGAVPPSPNYSDLWWNASESGWGVAITQQYGVIFATFYSYKPGGGATWFVAPNCPLAANRCSSGLYEVHGGTPPTAPWAGQNRVVSPVGTIEITFTDGDAATMRYTIGGIAAQRDIVRQAFGGRGGPAPVYSELFDALASELNGGFRTRGALVTDGTPELVDVCGISTVSTREEAEAQLRGAGGTITSSTPTEFCGTLEAESACFKLLGNVIVIDDRMPGLTVVDLTLTGLLPGRATEVAYGSDFGPAIIGSRTRDPSIRDVPCSNASLPTPTRAAINGNWYGYEFAYSLASRSGTTTPSTMRCANLTCSVLGGTSATFTLSADPLPWHTVQGAPRVAGMEISTDLQLLSMFVCSSPLDESKTFESCAFYTFRRDG